MYNNMYMYMYMYIPSAQQTNNSHRQMETYSKKTFLTCGTCGNFCGNLRSLLLYSGSKITQNRFWEHTQIALKAKIFVGCGFAGFRNSQVFACPNWGPKHPTSPKKIHSH